MEIKLPNTTSVTDCIFQHLNNNPDDLCCAIRVNGAWENYSRRQFKELVNRYAVAFRALLPQNTLILFIKKLDIHLLSAYIGAMHAGHVPAQVSFPSGKMSEQEYRKKITHIKESTGFGAIFSDSPDFLCHPGEHALLTPEILEGSYSAAPGAYQGEDALVQFSSGTTGLQKGVVLTHEGIMAHMHSYGTFLALRKNDAIVSWLPLYHDMGLIACYLMPLVWGIPFYQMDPFDWILQPDLLLQTVEQFRPSICYLPNFAFHVLSDKGRARDLASVRLWINCSEPARHRSHENFLQNFPSVNRRSLAVCYALAENTFAVSQTVSGLPITRQKNGEMETLSCGKIIPGVEVKIFDQPGSGVGEIGIRSPFLFNRFTNNSLPMLEDYYLTGDTGFLDESGELFVTGRKKDLIIVNGKNVHPQDVEYAASEVKGVYPGRVVSFGIWNEETGSEDLYVLVERQQGEPPTPIKIAVQKAVNGEIGLVPRRVEVLEHMSLVKTSSGKISRRRNREIYLEKGFTLV